MRNLDIDPIRIDTYDTPRDPSYDNENSFDQSLNNSAVKLILPESRSD